MAYISKGKMIMAIRLQLETMTKAELEEVVEKQKICDHKKFRGG